MKKYLVYILFLIVVALLAVLLQLLSGGSQINTDEGWGVTVYKASGDINSDTLDDVVYLITKEQTSGTLAYFVTARLAPFVAIRQLDPVFIDENISPHQVRVLAGNIAVFYTDPLKPPQRFWNDARYFRVQKNVIVEDVRPETGGEVCESDGDCWCRSFTGANFIEGMRIFTSCDQKTHTCVPCMYM